MWKNAEFHNLFELSCSTINLQSCMFFSCLKNILRYYLITIFSSFFFSRMMGRLLCPEKSEPGRKAEDTSNFHPSHAHPMSTNIPLQQQNIAIFPPISPVYLRPHPLNPRPVSSFADMPPLQERSHSSFQVLRFRQNFIS